MPIYNDETPPNLCCLWEVVGAERRGCDRNALHQRLLGYALSSHPRGSQRTFLSPGGDGAAIIPKPSYG
jgi:hypothetical protein